MADERPAWARRMSNERKARGWSYADAARALSAHATDEERKSLPDLESLKRSWMRWESGEVKPDGRPELPRVFRTGN